MIFDELYGPLFGEPTPPIKPRPKGLPVQSPGTMSAYSPRIPRMDGRLPGSVRDPSPLQRFVSFLTGVEPGSDDALAVVGMLGEGPSGGVKKMALAGRIGDITGGERITAASFRWKGKVFTGANHDEAIRAAGLDPENDFLAFDESDLGFATDKRPWIPRDIAKTIAAKANQMRAAMKDDPELYAEGLKR